MTLLLAAGCSLGEDDAVVVPAGLLSAETVGGTPTENAGRYTASAGPDTLTLVAAQRDEVARYRRGTEVVLLSVKERTPSSVASSTEDLLDCVENKVCNSEPVRFTATRLVDVEAELGDGTVAFSSVYDRPGSKRLCFKRSYTYLQPNPEVHGTLVMVSLERRGSTDPDDAELVRLTRAQVAKTKATLD